MYKKISQLGLFKDANTGANVMSTAFINIFQHSFRKNFNACFASFQEFPALFYCREWRVDFEKLFCKLSAKNKENF